MTLSKPMISEVSQIFEALGDESRLQILQVLLDAGRPMSQGEAAEAAGLSQSNASKHLIHLARVGLLLRVRQGNLSMFSLATPLVTELCELVCNHVKTRIQNAYRSCS